MNRSSFSAWDIPHYSKLLFKTLRTPLLVYLALMGNLITIAGSLIFFYYEKNLNPSVETLFDAFWWAVCTISSVGYGDIAPVTFEGRIVGMSLIVVGLTFFLGFMAVFISVLSSLSMKQTGSIEAEILNEIKVLRKEVRKIKVDNDF